MLKNRSHVSRILAVGKPSEDKIRRLTRGKTFTCCYGTETEHQQLSDFCLALQELLTSTGQELSDFTPEELGFLLQQFSREDQDA